MMMIKTVIFVADESVGFFYFFMGPINITLSSTVNNLSSRHLYNIL